jgi:DNA-binding NarL/FixJ family response regulator
MWDCLRQPIPAYVELEEDNGSPKTLIRYPVRTARVFRGNPITVAIADVNLMAVRLLSDLFKRYSNFAVVSCAIDRASFLQSVRQTRAAVALISADLQDGLLSGLDALREVHEADPELRPILLFDGPEPRVVLEALRAGARGFFSRRDFDFAALRKCIRRVYEGQIWIGNAELEYVLEAFNETRPRHVANPDGLNLIS